MGVEEKRVPFIVIQKKEIVSSIIMRCVDNRPVLGAVSAALPPCVLSSVVEVAFVVCPSSKEPKVLSPHLNHVTLIRHRERERV